MDSTRDELVAALDAALTRKNIAVAQASAEHDVYILEAQEKLNAFDANAGVDEAVEEAVESSDEDEVSEDLEVVEEVEVEAVEEEVVEVEGESVDAPTAEEEEILRRAAEIEARYQRQ